MGSKTKQKSRKQNKIKGKVEEFQGKEGLREGHLTFKEQPRHRDLQHGKKNSKMRTSSLESCGNSSNEGLTPGILSKEEFQQRTYPWKFVERRALTEDLLL